MDPALDNDPALDHIRAVADAVLYEGYLLYPYRASAAKNQAQARWQFGVLVPPSYLALDTGEHAEARTECLAQAPPEAVLRLRVRFLQVQRRTLQAASPAGYVEVESLPIGDDEVVPWDEAVEHEVVSELPVADLLRAEQAVPVTAPGGIETEAARDGRIVRERQPVTGQLRCHAERLPGGQVLRISAVLANTADTDCGAMNRTEVLRHSLIAAHTVLAIGGGEFISLLEPPDWAVSQAKECVNQHTWPVLVGPEHRNDTMLSSPIILYDYPKIDPRSQGEFYDSCEIDELLTLRTLTLTEQEKREARATDARARELIDRVHDLPPELMERLHGAVSYLERTRTVGPEPMPPATERRERAWWEQEDYTPRRQRTDSVRIDGHRVTSGSRVVLRPARTGDAQDMFVAGKAATVRDVLVDVDDVWYLAVTVDSDPAAEWQLAQHRFRYFTTDEVEPVGDGVTP